MQKGRTGAANGRVGGRLSGGKRARTALKAVPRVRVVGAASRTAGGGIVAAPALQSAPAVDPLAVAAATTQSMGALLGLTPTRMGQAAQVAMATLAAFQAAGGAPAATSTPTLEQPAATGGKRKLSFQAPASGTVDFPKTKAWAAAAPGSTLAVVKRGALVAIQPAVSYRAGKDYDWDDVCAVGRLILEGNIKEMTELDKKKPDGSPLYKVPRTTMNKWVKHAGLRCTVCSVVLAAWCLQSASWVVTQLVTPALRGPLAGVCSHDHEA